MFPVELGESFEVEGRGGPPPGQSGQHRSILVGQQLFHGVNAAVAVGLGQQNESVHIPAGSIFQGGIGVPPLGQQGVGSLGVPQPVPQPVSQTGKALLPQMIEDGGVGVQGLLAPALGQRVQKAAHLKQDRLGGQVPISGQAPKGGPQRVQFHGGSLLYLSVCVGFSQF